MKCAVRDAVAAGSRNSWGSLSGEFPPIAKVSAKGGHARAAWHSSCPNTPIPGNREKAIVQEARALPAQKYGDFKRMKSIVMNIHEPQPRPQPQQQTSLEQRGIAGRAMDRVISHISD